MQTTVGEAGLLFRSRERGRERCEHVADQDDANCVGFEPGAAGTVENVAVGVLRDALEDRHQFVVDREGSIPAPLVSLRRSALRTARRRVVDDLDNARGEVDVAPAQTDRFADAHTGVSQGGEQYVQPEQLRPGASVLQNRDDFVFRPAKRVGPLRLAQGQIDPRRSRQPFLGDQERDDLFDDVDLQVTRPVRLADLFEIFKYATRTFTVTPFQWVITLLARNSKNLLRTGR